MRFVIIYDYFSSARVIPISAVGRDTQEAGTGFWIKSHFLPCIRDATAFDDAGSRGRVKRASTGSGEVFQIFDVRCPSLKGF